MTLYESVFIVRQDASAQQVDAISEGLSNIVKENGGEVPKTEYWGLKTMAFRIKRNRKGHYVLLNIDAPWDAVSEMERNMRLNEDVLRHLTLRVTQLEEGPSAMMRAKAGREDHGRRDRDRSGNREAPRDASAASAESTRRADKNIDPAASDSPGAVVDQPEAVVDKEETVVDKEGAVDDKEGAAR